MSVSKRLWVAIVEHRSVPGAKAALFYQANSPSDKTIKARFTDGQTTPRDIVITYVMNLTLTCAVDSVSCEALAQVVAQTIARKRAEDSIPRRTRLCYECGCSRKRTAMNERHPVPGLTVWVCKPKCKGAS